MYKIIKSEFKGFDENNNIQNRVEIIVDTSSDVPEPVDSWTVGSMALCADTQNVLVLNNRREWV